MKLSVREDRAIPLPELLQLYGSVGWVNYTARPERLEAALRGSLTVLGAWAENDDGAGTLVGIARAVGDGCTIVFIQDILVLPEYQRQGWEPPWCGRCSVAGRGSIRSNWPPTGRSGRCDSTALWDSRSFVSWAAPGL